MYALALELVEGPTLAEHLQAVASSSTPVVSGFSRTAIGIPLDEALPIARQIADALAAAPEDRSHVVLHSSGIGNLSRPRLGPANSRGDAPIVLQPGMTFDFKPALRLKRTHAQDVGPENRVVQLGDHVLVTDIGVVRLGTRHLGPLLLS